MVTKAKPRKKNERNDGPYKKLRADLKAGTARSEERSVRKECRSRWSTYH